MNLKDFTLMKEDAGSYTVGHPQGRSFRVSKTGLSSKAQELVSKLKRHQNLKDGGESQEVEEPPAPPAPGVAPSVPVEDTSPATILAMPPPAPGVPPSGMDSAMNMAPPSMPNVTASVEQAANPQPEPSQQPAPTAPAASPLLPDIAGALTKERGALEAGAKAEADVGKAQAKEYDKFLAESQSIPTPQETFSKYHEQDQKFQNEITNNKIDPNRLLAHQGTLSKITSGIAMILGGIGSSLTGQPNMAAQMIKEAVDRDIDAQKNEQNKNMTLWKMNRENMSSEIGANLSTENQMLGVVKARMMMAAGQAAGPMAQARIAPVIGQIDQQIQHNNWKKTLLSQQDVGGLSRVDPTQLVPVMTSDKEVANEATHEIGKKQYLNQNYDQLMALYKQAQSENTALGRASRGGREPPAMHALKTMLDPIIKDKDGRINEIASGHVDAMLPRILTGKGTDKEALEHFSDFLNQGPPAPFSKRIGIDLNRYHSTAPRSQTQYKTVNGVKYTRGPNGEAIKVQ